MTHSTEEDLVRHLKHWGSTAHGISCILQMDVDSVPKPTSRNTEFGKSLKFMVVTDTVEAYMHKPVWLETFGSYTKCHKANHGFFQILKVSYTCGITISFVLIKANEKKDIYTFCEMEDMESSVRILVKKD